MGSLISPESLKTLLVSQSGKKTQQPKTLQNFDLISFGGGSCPRVIGKYSSLFGWNKICFLTNGSDNGGSTYKIVEGLRPEFGPTLPVGDISSALIGLLPSPQFELLNLRAWKLDPKIFSNEEQITFLEAVKSKTTFLARLEIAIQWHKRKQNSNIYSSSSNSENFFKNVAVLGNLVDETGLIRKGIKGLDLEEASVRHHIFNSVMIKTGAYEISGKSPDVGKFESGLTILQRALGVGYSVFPCSINEQILFAEWKDKNGLLVWSTKHQSADHQLLDIGGQVALSNAPDSVKLHPEGTYAKYSRFGFDTDYPQPQPYPEALEAIKNLKAGSPILFGPSSFVASISPCLAVDGIVKELEKRVDCPKILFLNLTLNNETIGMSVTDFLDFWELNTASPVWKTLNYVVINNDTQSTPEIACALEDRGDSLDTFKFRGKLILTEKERLSLPKRGVSLVEAPLATVKRQLIRLSSEGERENVWVPNHHSKRLMEITKVLVKDFLDSKKREDLNFVKSDSIQNSTLLRIDGDPAFELYLYPSGFLE